MHSLDIHNSKMTLAWQRVFIWARHFFCSLHADPSSLIIFIEHSMVLGENHVHYCMSPSGDDEGSI